MARKTVLVSDLSGEEIAEGTGYSIRFTPRDGRKRPIEMDVTDSEAEQMAANGRTVARRGRRPKVSADS